MDQPRPYDSITFSWLGRGKISKEVRHQRGCSCCWIIAPEEATEALYKIENPDESRIRLSVQEVVDCLRKKYPTASKIGEVDKKGCYPSNFTNFFKYLMEQGVVEDHVYRFNAEIGACKSCEIKSPRYTIKDYVRLEDDNEAAILHAIDKQPIVAAMDVYTDLELLKKEVYIGPANVKEEHHAHAVLIVGYGIENCIPYYVVKSSCGTKWGIGGFGKIARTNFRNFMYPLGPVSIRK